MISMSYVPTLDVPVHTVMEIQGGIGTRVVIRDDHPTLTVMPDPPPQRPVAWENDTFVIRPRDPFEDLARDQWRRTSKRHRKAQRPRWRR